MAVSTRDMVWALDDAYRAMSSRKAAARTLLAFLEKCPDSGKSRGYPARYRGPTRSEIATIYREHFGPNGHRIVGSQSRRRYK